MRTAIDQIIFHESKCQQQITSCTGFLIRFTCLKILYRDCCDIFILGSIRISNQLPVRRHKVFGRRNSLDNCSLRHISKGYLIQRFIQQIIKRICLCIVISKPSGFLFHDIVVLITFHEKKLLRRHTLRRIIIKRHSIFALMHATVHITIHNKVDISVFIHICNVDIEIRI